jgi:hypothetical protein
MANLTRGRTSIIIVIVAGRWSGQPTGNATDLSTVPILPLSRSVTNEQIIIATFDRHAKPELDRTAAFLLVRHSFFTIGFEEETRSFVVLDPRGFVVFVLDCFETILVGDGEAVVDRMRGSALGWESATSGFLRSKH